MCLRNNHLGNQLTAYLRFMVCILYIRVTKSAIKCAHMADARDTFHVVKSMSILCLWVIQLTFDRNVVGTCAYHHKSELKRCNRVQFVFNPPKFAEVSANLELANSTRTDYSAMQSINGMSLKEHWATQHCLQEAIVAQRSRVYISHLS